MKSYTIEIKTKSMAHGQQVTKGELKLESDDISDDLIDELVFDLELALNVNKEHPMRVHIHNSPDQPY